MMTQPIQTLQNLTSETTPAGGNAFAKGGPRRDSRAVEVEARDARAINLADVIGDVAHWGQAQYKRLIAGIKARLQLRAAEAQLFRMTDRELADLGLYRTDIPFAVRRAVDEAIDGQTPLIQGPAEARPAANQNLRHVAA